MQGRVKRDTEMVLDGRFDCGDVGNDGGRDTLVNPVVIRSD